MTKLILCYHRVDEAAFDPHRLAIRPTLFAAQMAILQSEWTALPLEELLHVRDEPSGDLVAVTFDDGYFDNLQFAAPILNMYGIPATFFVATHHVLTGESFYWDALWSMLVHPRAYGRTIAAMTHLGKILFQLPSLPEESGEVTWTMKDGPKHDRHAAYATLGTMLQYREVSERRELLSAIGEQCNVDYGEVETPGIMTTTDLRALAADGNFQVQPHTMNHVSLGVVPIERAVAEVEGSIRHLETVFQGGRYQFLAYPYGGHLDVRRSLEGPLRQVGIQAGFSTRGRPVLPRDSQMRLPRVCVTSRTLDGFNQLLAKARHDAARSLS